MGRRTRKIAEQVEDYEPPKKEEEPDRKDPNNFIPTGSTMLNLSISDMINGGWQLGKIFNLIGDSSTGKTLLALVTLAEMCQYERFDDYRLIFDDVEYGCGFDISKVSPRLSTRIEPPKWTEVSKQEKKRGVVPEPIYSDTIQDFHDNVLDIIDEGRPFAYIADSFDALDAEEDIKKLNAARAARKKGIKTKGSYGIAKARIASHFLRSIKAKVAATNSIVIIISQTRDNIDPMSFVEKTRSGGRALKFFSWIEMWLAFMSAITSKKIQIGGNSLIKVTKNRTTGKKRTVPLAIYDEFGVDDIGPNLDFLSTMHDDWEKIKETGSIIPPKNFLKGEKMSRARMIRTVESKDLEEELRLRCQELWDHIERGLLQNRKRRYR